MQRKITLFMFNIIVFIAQFSIGSAQSWKELMDSTNFYKSKNDFQTAIKWAKSALNVGEQEFGRNDTNYYFNLVSLAENYFFLGKVDSAIVYAEANMKICRAKNKPDDPYLSASISWLATYYDRHGDYSLAEPLYLEALEINKRIYNKNDPNLAATFNNLALFYSNRSEYSKAEPLYLNSLEILRSAFKEDHPNLAATLNNLGLFYNNRSDYKKAEPLYKESLEMSRRLFKGDHPDLVKIINGLASFYENIGNYNQAEILFNESLDMRRRLFKNDNPALALGIHSMGRFYRTRGDLKKAEPLIKEALDMGRRIFKGDHRDLAVYIKEMGIFYKEKREFNLAEPFHKEALDMNRRIFKTDNINLAQSINDLGIFYFYSGDFIKAEPCLKEALEIYKRLFKNEQRSTIISVYNLASLYYTKGDFELAEKYFLDVIEYEKSLLNNYFPSLSEKEKQLYWNSTTIHFQAFNSFSTKRYNENPAILGNMYDNQLYTKSILFNSTSKIKKRIVNSNDQTLIDKFKTFNDKKELLVKLYAMTDDTRKKKGFNIDSIEKITNDLEKELSLKSELYTQSYEKKKVTWKTVQAILKPDEAAVEVVRFRYFDKKRLTDTVYYAFLIINDLTEEHPDIVLLENGNQLENEFYNDYRANTNKKNIDKNSFDRFWAKLFDKIKEYKKVYFSADGIYNKLNPSTFQLPDGKYLLDLQDIQQVNSTRDLLIGYYQTKQESNIFNSALLIGNPNFNLSEEEVKVATRKIRSKTDEEKSYEPMASTRGISLSKLPGTEKEVSDIEKFLKGRNWIVNSYLGDNALKTAIKTANNPRVLHIATHGLFLEDVKRESSELFGFSEKNMIENPLLRSGLFFTGADNYLKRENSNAENEEDNGLLTAYEAMNLDLDKTELVVLSACETGLGEIQNGEGVFGLRRAFQQAGAKTVMMSLWKVDDSATQELMSSFYKNWVTGMTKRDAFSKAQQEVKAKYKDPYYWGAFVMVGE